ncbi:MAG: Osmotically-inducible protein Y precursor [Syntrophus sp. PtaB.Bin001]|jgi:osmotically-inducible protein OsmY|nr:MAG: Osmotically-inducible protein Y precursor [Syntrophus sp. PtaB.Bin001]
MLGKILTLIGGSLILEMGKIPINNFMNLKKGGNEMAKFKIMARVFLSLLLVAAFLSCASTPKSSSTGEVIDDSVITTKVKALLAEDVGLKTFQISVETYKGVVQLSGFVDSQKDIDNAGRIARSVQGVVSVKNNLILK